MSSREQSGSERRLAAIISTDVVGYSRHMAEDDKATVKTLQSHRETMRGTIREHHGRVVDAVGDNLLAEFHSAVDAVNCALEIQNVLSERNGLLEKARRMPFRMGIHIGDLLVDGEQIFGDGINIAARLEAMAPPGGICASAAVVEQVRGKTDARFEDLGEHELKNIPAPVRVWRLSLDEQGGQGVAAMSVAGFAGRPAIAVLPFENRTGDPDQEFLADGIVEDVIAGLSAYCAFPVIARSSTFSYKGKHVDARQSGRELGARYVVGGSVRKAGNRIRVATELVDSKTGRQINAERFERELGDLFELQDDIVSAIICSIEPAVFRAEVRRVSRKPTGSLDAWENLQKGLSMMMIGNSNVSKAAEPYIRRALELDPNFAAACAALCLFLWARVYFTWEIDPEPVLKEARKIGRKAVQLAPDDPRAHLALGWMHWYSGNRTAAKLSFERAIELNPSLADAWWALASILSDERPDEALAFAKKAVRLSPRDQSVTIALHICAVCAFLGEHDEQAVEWERKSVAHPAGPQSYRLLGAALGHLGKLEEAREAIDEAMRRAPNFTLMTLRAGNSPRLVDRLVEGWRKAGWSPPP